MTPQQPTKHAAKTISHCFSILLTNLRFHFFLLPFALSLLALVSFGTKTAQAQTIPTAEQIQTLPPIYPQIRFGLFGAGNLNWHVASFRTLPEAGQILTDQIGGIGYSNPLIARNDTL
ncbi:MAG: hypothetical protein ACOVSW_10615, partial [Candidatus Kapaibacteriota bacterium]